MRDDPLVRSRVAAAFTGSSSAHRRTRVCIPAARGPSMHRTLMVRAGAPGCWGARAPRTTRPRRTRSRAARARARPWRWRPAWPTLRWALTTWPACGCARGCSRHVRAPPPCCRSRRRACPGGASVLPPPRAAGLHPRTPGAGAGARGGVRPVRLPRDCGRRGGRRRGGRGGRAGCARARRARPHAAAPRRRRARPARRCARPARLQSALSQPESPARRPWSRRARRQSPCIRPVLWKTGAARQCAPLFACGALPAPPLCPPSSPGPDRRGAAADARAACRRRHAPGAHRAGPCPAEAHAQQTIRAPARQAARTPRASWCSW